MVPTRRSPLSDFTASAAFVVFLMIVIWLVTEFLN